MSTREFYEARAAECGRDAESTTLQNVRERALRAQAAWLGMAGRIERGDKRRASLAAEKAAAAASSASLMLADVGNDDDEDADGAATPAFS